MAALAGRALRFNGDRPWRPSRLDAVDAPAREDLAALLTDQCSATCSHSWPGAVLGVEKLLDERGLRVLLRQVAAPRGRVLKVP